MAVFASPAYTATFTANTAKRQPWQGFGTPFARGAYVLLTTDFDDGDVCPLMPLPSNLVVTAIIAHCDGAATAGVVDVGVITLDDAGAVETTHDDDLFDAAYDTTSADTGTNIVGLNAVTVDELIKPLWEVAGLSTDPGGDMWLALTGETANLDASTKVYMEVRGFL